MRRLRVGDARLRRGDVVGDVAVGGEHVEPAVEIVVEEEAREGEGQHRRLANRRRRRLVDEQAVALVLYRAIISLEKLPMIGLWRPELS